MDGKFQLFISGTNGKTTIVEVQKGSTVDNFLAIVSEKYGIKQCEMYLVYAGKKLQSQSCSGKNQSLSDYKIKNNCTLYFMLRLPGGVIPRFSGRKETLVNPDLVPLPPFIEVCNERDDYLLDDDPHTKRAKMPCKHVIAPDAMKSMLQAYVDDDKFTFRCTVEVDTKTGTTFGQEWPWFMVRHVAPLYQSEIDYFEKRLSELFLTKSAGIQECPGCRNSCQRQDVTNPRVLCTLCTKEKNRMFEFCWYCLHKWGGGSHCRNKTCKQVDQRINILDQCQLKTIGSAEHCPEIRMCPECGILINHDAACKHMTCNCGHQFCFVCLKPWGNCGSWNAVCNVAHKQTKVPEKM